MKEMALRTEMRVVVITKVPSHTSGGAGGLGMQHSFKSPKSAFGGWHDHKLFLPKSLRKTWQW
jgi:hypothetical protein